MRLSSFLLISFAVHATALSYPLVFRVSQGEDLVPVIVLSLGDGGPDGTRGDRRAEGKEGKPAGLRRLAPLRPAERDSETREQTLESKKPSEISLSLADASTGLAETSVVAPSTETVESLSIRYTTGSGGDAGSGGNGNSGAGTGAGIGTGAGVVSGEGRAGSRFVQVSYAYNPKPEYPDKARREGKEGTVLLRVLVDEQGRSKVVELSRSSGFEALDKAALNAIRHWRFSPARYEEKSVESWASIPIVFRLADPKN